MAGWNFLEFTSFLNCGQFQNSDCILFNHMWLRRNISQCPDINCFPRDQSRAGPRWSMKQGNKMVFPHLFLAPFFPSVFFPRTKSLLFSSYPFAHSWQHLPNHWANPLHMTHPPEAFHWNNSFLKAENCLSQLSFVSRNGLFQVYSAWKVHDVCKLCVVCSVHTRDEPNPRFWDSSSLPDFKGIEWICLGIWRNSCEKWYLNWSQIISEVHCIGI